MNRRELLCGSAAAAVVGVLPAFPVESRFVSMRAPMTVTLPAGTWRMEFLVKCAEKIRVIDEHGKKHKLVSGNAITITEDT